MCLLLSSFTHTETQLLDCVCARIHSGPPFIGGQSLAEGILAYTAHALPPMAQTTSVGASQLQHGIPPQMVCCAKSPRPREALAGLDAEAPITTREGESQPVLDFSILHRKVVR